MRCVKIEMKKGHDRKCFRVNPERDGMITLMNNI